jgi:hypothetical protein
MPRAQSLELISLEESSINSQQDPFNQHNFELNQPAHKISKITPVNDVEISHVTMKSVEEGIKHAHEQIQLLQQQKEKLMQKKN